MEEKLINPWTVLSRGGKDKHRSILTFTTWLEEKKKMYIYI